MNQEIDRWSKDDALIAAIPERSRLAAVAWVFRCLTTTAEAGGTYRVLLRQFGFSELVGSEDPYRYLIEAGAMGVNNALATKSRETEEAVAEEDGEG